MLFFCFFFEIQVQGAGKRLDTFAQRLSQVEQTFQTGDDEVDQISVMDLLESVTEVKHEYENLQKDIKEVQQLQKEMAVSLRYQMRSMSQTFRVLKRRLEKRLEPLSPAQKWKKKKGRIYIFNETKNR